MAFYLLFGIALFVAGAQCALWVLIKTSTEKPRSKYCQLPLHYRSKN